MRKYEIARLLARRYGYESYLEVCTPYTGGTFSLVDKKQFSRRMRLMYRRPLSFSGGERVDFSTEAESGEELFSELMKSGERFDLIFVDPWHIYISSLRDITFGLQLIKDNGALLIHDCSPPNATCAEPEYRDGCGIISKDQSLGRLYKPQPATPLASQWQMLNVSEKYAFFDENRSQLLHLISADTYCLHFDNRRRRVARRIRRLIRRPFSSV